MPEAKNADRIQPASTGAAANPRPSPFAFVLFGNRRPGPPQAHPGAVSPGRGETSPRFAIVGFARRDWTDETSAGNTRRAWPRGAARIRKTTGPSSPATSFSYRGRSTTRRLRQAQAAARGARPHPRDARQPALLPGRLPRILRDDHRAPGQGGTDLSRHQETPWSRVVIEKPFGHDLAGARR